MARLLGEDRLGCIEGYVEIRALAEFVDDRGERAGRELAGDVPWVYPAASAAASNAHSAVNPGSSPNGAARITPPQPLDSFTA